MAHVPGLRSPYVKVGRLVYFGRMIDKIRLHAQGKLPVDDYAGNLGRGFDLRCCTFLGIAYADLKARALAGAETPEALLGWAEQTGSRPTDDQVEVWNAFMTKRGFRDDAAPILAKRIRESGFESKPVSTMFDYIDFDEGRDPVSTRAWEA